MKKPTLYIMANKYHGTLYTGVTSNLLLRVFQHKNGMGSEFALKYGCKILVYYFFFDSVTDAIAAEKKLKQGSRQRKIRLIESVNSEWKDLYAHFFHST